jgi:hypothetical protein
MIFTFMTKETLMILFFFSCKRQTAMPPHNLNYASSPPLHDSPSPVWIL